MTCHIRKLICKRDRLFKKFKRTSNPAVWVHFKKVRNSIVNAIRRAKINFFRSVSAKLSDPGLCSKKWWHLSKSLLNNREKRRIPFLLDNGSSVTNDANIAEIFNNFFASQSTLCDDSGQLPAFSFRTTERLSIITVSKMEIHEILESLDTSKASGYDGLGNKVLKMLAPALSEPLSHLFNLSLQSGVFPNYWKFANVNPIFKKGDPHCKTNYRPISLLPCLSKVLERLVANRLLYHLLRNNLISSRQSGFMPKDSTVNQLLFIVNKIIVGFEKGLETRAIFLDISKAFDKVWHKGLLFKLKQNGITDTLLEWFNSYLHDRHQRVVINGAISDWKGTSGGVPQGSVLGPILFLTFINDITDGIISGIFLFADDTSLLNTVSPNNSYTTQP